LTRWGSGVQIPACLPFLHLSSFVFATIFCSCLKETDNGHRFWRRSGNFSQRSLYVITLRISPRPACRWLSYSTVLCKPFSSLSCFCSSTSDRIAASYSFLSSFTELVRQLKLQYIQQSYIQSLEEYLHPS
jgi:hypothetical protein